MVKKTDICMLMITFTILISFITIPVAADSTPPASITSLSVVSYGTTYIKWKWTDPTTSDFDHVDVYINGIFKANVPKGVKYYNATGLIPYTTYKISTHTVDISGNINQTWKNSSRKTAKDSIPPGIVTNLYASSIGTNSIKWKWTDPSDIDFTKVMIYINGVFKTNVAKGTQSYTAKNLSPDTTYKISTRTVDTSGNIGIWTNDTKKTNSIFPIHTQIRFVTIGDTHITANTSKDAYKNFTRAVNYINGMTNVDFVVQMGDIVDSASSDNFNASKSILDNLTKHYYIVEGNHDIGTLSGANFRKYIGPTENIVNFNGYQLIFVGIDNNGTKNANNTTIVYDWIFNYDNVDKNKPTIIFSHGPVQPKPGGICSDWDSNANKEVYFSYACNMKPEVDKFTNLTAYYAGHVHKGTNQTIGNTLYVTEDNLGGDGPDSQYIGYTVVQDGRVVSYSTIHY